MENEIEILKALQSRKLKVIKELEMLDQAITFYGGNVNAKSLTGHLVKPLLPDLSAKPHNTKRGMKRSGNTKRIVTKALEMIKARAGKAVSVQEIADALVADGFPTDYYSLSLPAQVSSFLSRNKKRRGFVSTAEGWVIR